MHEAIRPLESSVLIALIGLFFSAFGAATILPLQSEVVLSTLIVKEIHSVWLLVVVASVGNILGSLLNWWLGKQVHRFRHTAWFPVNEIQFDKAVGHYQTYGYWSLLLSWVPVIGDPITIIAGVMKEPIWRFLLMVSVAKIGRYVVVVMMTLNIFS